jgi:antirestriction protein ArdC
MSMSVAAVARDGGYRDTSWGMRKEVEAGGGRILKGEQGTEVISEGVEGEVSRHTVFNAEQADGLPSPPLGSPEPSWEVHKRADNLIRASGVSIDHRNGNQAYYLPDKDRVVLPVPMQFVSPEHYYQAAVHELGHATGHGGRLNRESLRQGVEAGYDSEAYAKEELRAEISASLTGERIGVGHDPGRGEHYADSWVKVLEEDPGELERAAEEAQEISDYLMDRARERAAKEQPRPVSPEAWPRKSSPVRQPTPRRTPKQTPSPDEVQDHEPSR